MKITITDSAYEDLIDIKEHYKLEGVEHIGDLFASSLDLTEATASLKDKFFPSSWNHNIFNGKTKGIPAFLDAGMLYYRKDLLGKLRISPAI